MYIENVSVVMPIGVQVVTFEIPGVVKRETVVGDGLADFVCQENKIRESVPEVKGLVLARIDANRYHFQYSFVPDSRGILARIVLAVRGWLGIHSMPKKRVAA